MKTSTLLVILLVILGLGCGGELEPIKYGKDNCHWCQMKIVDPQFGSEAITTKGRCYKFDSAECLIHYLLDSGVEHTHVAVTNYELPETLMDARTSWFLVSENMPSPMGGNLNAFQSEATAKSYQEKEGGQVFNWEGINNEYAK